MTWQIAITDLDGDPVVADLPYLHSGFSFTHVLNGPGSAEIDVSMARVDRADIEPGQRRYRISEDGTLRSAGTIWGARIDTNFNTRQLKLTGEGMAGYFTRRLIAWQARYEPITEDPVNLNTQYGLSQEDILWDLVDRAQAEPGGDLGLTQGAHTGGTHTRRRWWCAEFGTYLQEVFDDFAALEDGLDWAITPTLTDDTLDTLVTFNPARGSDVSGSVSLEGTQFLDNLVYEIDARQIVSRGRAVGLGECEPPFGDDFDSASLAAYGLLEAFEESNSDRQEDADEVARGLISSKPVVGTDVWYELSEGPALGTFDVGDIIAVSTTRDAGWGFSADMRVQEIEVHVQLPDDEEHTFVRVNVAEAFELEESS